MLTLLPAVDVRNGKAVRLRQGESGSETDYGSPLEAAQTWVDASAQWIHLVDLDAHSARETIGACFAKSCPNWESRLISSFPAEYATMKVLFPRWKQERAE